MALDAHRSVVAGLSAPEAQALLGRHGAFWAREAVDRPLLKCTRRRPSLPEPHEESVALTPERLWDDLSGKLDRLDRRLEQTGIVDGDLWRTVSLPGRPPWMPAILGCPMWVSRASGALRWGALAGGWEALQEIVPGAGREWRQALRHGLGKLVSRFGGRYPIATFHGRGPVDMLAQALGDEALALRVADDPESLAPVLANLTALWIEVAREVMQIVPPVRGGHFHRYGIWAPGSLAAMTTDAAGLFSVESYRQVFLPHDRAIHSALDHLLIHTHSAALRHHVTWVMLPGALVQVLEDPGASTTWPELAQVLQSMQDGGHPLLLSLGEQYLASARSELSPRGLALEEHLAY